jgi:lysophospholipase L1-like esterase
MTDTQKNIFTGRNASDFIKLQILEKSLRKHNQKYNILIANEELKQLEQEYKFIIQEEDENDEIINVYHPFTKEETEKMEQEYNQKAKKIYKKLNKHNEEKDLIKAEIEKIKFDDINYFESDNESDIESVNQDEDEDENIDWAEYQEDENEGKDKPLYYNKNNTLYINVEHEDN